MRHKHVVLILIVVLALACLLACQSTLTMSSQELQDFIVTNAWLNVTDATVAGW